MGKLLSIIAITTQVYNINGWSIYPPHLVLGDDVELPASMEYLRPYLRKRSGPIRAPPGLQHNRRYNSHLIDHANMMRNYLQRDLNDLPSDIRGDFKTFYQSFQKRVLGSDNKHELRQQYRKLRYHPLMNRFLNDLIRYVINHIPDESEPQKTQKIMELLHTVLNEMIFADQFIFNPQQMAFHDSILYSLQQTSKDYLHDLFLTGPKSLESRVSWFFYIPCQNLAIGQGLIPSQENIDAVYTPDSEWVNVKPGLESFDELYKYKIDFIVYDQFTPPRLHGSSVADFRFYGETLIGILGDYKKYPYVAYHLRTQCMYLQNVLMDGKYQDLSSFHNTSIADTYHKILVQVFKEWRYAENGGVSLFRQTIAAKLRDYKALYIIHDHTDIVETEYVPICR